MPTMQPYVKQWYDYLAAGQVMATRCRECGGIEFPPLSICNACSAVDLEWTALSGKGQMTAFNVPLQPLPEYASFWPFVHGNVLMEEGVMYGGMVLGVGPDDVEWLYQALPVPVEAETRDRDGVGLLAFHLAG